MKSKIGKQHYSEIGELYVSGLTLRNIATRFDVAEQTINKILVRMGIPRRHRGPWANCSSGRRCSTCRKTKPLSDFNKDRSKLFGYSYLCKDCTRNKFTARLPFGLTTSTYTELLKKQSSECAICGRTTSHISRNGHIAKLAVDHDHATGRIRGLLCMRCNQGLGYFADDIAILYKAIHYLSQYQSVSPAEVA